LTEHKVAFQKDFLRAKSYSDYREEIVVRWLTPLPIFCKSIAALTFWEKCFSRRLAKEKNPMFAITGITGNVGGQVARNLLAANQTVRGVMRDVRKGEVWAQLGCQLAAADISDVAALTAAFTGAEGVFVLVPSNFDPSPDFPEARAIAATLRSALEAARPGRIVYLSTIGAQAIQSNLLTQHSIIEQSLRELPTPIVFLRPAWFMENYTWDVAPAMSSGLVPSFLQPLDRKFPMVATADIARTAAELLQEKWTGHRVVELEGPDRVTPNEIAAAFTHLLGRPVRMEAVPRATWESLFKSQGMKNPTPRIQMLDGFNEGWIEFENGEVGSRKGSIEIESVLQTLIEREKRP
jgi:NAD(P)H dehydrogenase (quinone)